METMAKWLGSGGLSGGIPSMIRHRDTGWLVEPGNKQMKQRTKKRTRH
jgi:hypothetical protein